MKKIYTIVAAFAVVLSANAQKGSITNDASVQKYNKGLVKHVINNTTRAIGDTLMYMPLPGYYVNPTDQAAFDIITQDIDQLPTNNAGYAMDFGLYYSTDSSVNGMGQPLQSNFYHPWETPAPAGTDSSFFWSATSWFNPAGQADNWLMFGPLTIPATGATLKWYDRTNRWRDGYKVTVTTSFSSPLDFGDFNDPAIFTETDDAFPSATYAVDTTWELKTVSIPATYNGLVVAIAFHHDANDMDVLRLDEITLVEGGTVGVNEFVNGAKFSQNTPNPFGTITTINYELQAASKVTLNVYDVTGKKVIEQNQGELAAGKHAVKVNAENLASGVYYYSLKVNENTTSSMKMVVVK